MLMKRLKLRCNTFVRLSFDAHPCSKMAENEVTVASVEFSDAVLLILMILATLKLIDMFVRRCSRLLGKWFETVGESANPSFITPTLSLRQHLLSVLQRPLKKSSVHVDLIRMAERVTIDDVSFAESNVSTEPLAMLDRARRVVYCLLDKLDDDRNSSLRDLKKEFAEALKNDRDASEQLLDLLPRLPQLRTLSLLRASTNQGVLAPLFIAIRRSFAGHAQFADIKFNNEARSWTINIDTNYDARSVQRDLERVGSTMQAFHCSDVIGLAPPTVATSTADVVTAADCRILSAKEFLTSTSNVVRIQHIRQFDCMRFENDSTTKCTLKFRFRLQLCLLLAFPDDTTKSLEKFAIECLIDEVEFETDDCDRETRTKITNLLKSSF